VNHLKDRYHCCTMDLPGHGTNQTKPDHFSVQHSADVIAETLQSVPWKPAAVAGHSLGGLVALELALRHPEQMKNRDSPTQFLLVDVPTIQVRFGFLRKMILRTLDKHFEEGIRKQVSRMTERPDLYQKIVKMALATDRQAYRQYMDNLLKSDYRRHVDTIPFPVHALLTRSLASSTHVLDSVLKKYGYHKLTPSQVHYFPESGHYLMLEQPFLLAEKIHEILESQEERSTMEM